MSDSENYTQEERKRYWQKPGKQKWLNLLNKEFSQLKWRSAGQSKMVGCCPFHNDSSPSAFIDLDYQLFKCVGCGTVHTDPIRFYAEAKNKDYSTAFKQMIIVEFGLKVKKKREKVLEEFDGHQDMMHLLKDVSCDLLRKASKNLGDEEYEFARKSVLFLNQRGIDINSAASLGVGVFPRLRDIHQYQSKNPKKYQRAYALLKDYFVRKGIIPENLTLPGKYGGDYLTFPYYSAPNIMGRMKLRSASGSNAYSSWVGPGSNEGFFGLNAYNSLISNDQRLSISEKVFLVEGEFDQLTFYQQMEKKGGIDSIIISGSGSGISGVKKLPFFGFKKAIAVGDHDSGGREFIKRVLLKSKETDKAAFYAFEYPDAFRKGDDPDDICRRGDFQIFHDAIHDSDNWRESHEWSAKQVADICNEEDSMDLGSKLRLVREYADLVKEGPIRGEYITSVAEELELSESKLRQDMASTDTEPGFVRALKRELSQLFEPLVIEGNFTVLCYSKVNGMLFSLPTKRQREMVLKLQNFCFETDAFSWVSHTMGIPDFIVSDPNSRKGFERREKDQYREIEEYVYRATDSYVSERAKPIDQFEVRRQGVHFFDAHEDLVDNKKLPKDFSEKRVVIVNGLDVYIGELEEDENGEIKDTVTYRNLGIPVHSKYLFETNDKNFWSDSIVDEEVLNEPVTFDEFKSAVEDVQKIVDVFPWDRPDLQKVYSPCYMAMLPISMLAENFPLDANTGPTQSGKSTYIKTVLRGDNGYGVVEHSTGYDDYTAAGLTQAAGGSSLLMCVDEFEDADDSTAGRRAHIVQNTLEMFRNISEGTRQTRGTQSGENREEYLRFPVSVAMIHTFKKEEDLNRWILSRMVPDRINRETPPAVELRQLFSKERYKEIRRAFTLYPVQNAGMFYKLQKEVSHEVFEQKKVPCTEHRFLHSMLMVLAVAKHLGWDYIDYAKKHVDYHEKNLELSVMSEEKRLFRALFQTKAVRLQQDGDIYRTVLEILNDSELAMRLSGANCGVYYRPDTDYVIIDPYSAATSILSRNSVYRNITNTYSVFQRLKRHPDVHHSPKTIMSDPMTLNHLYTYISRTDPEELLIVYLKDLRHNGHTEDELIEI